MLFWIAIAFILRDRLKEKKLQNKKTRLEKIGIGFSVFVILIKGVFFFGTPQTSAYDSAVSFIKTDPELQNRVGTVNSIFLAPLGSVSISTNSQGTAGQADLHFVIKGSKKFEDLNLLMDKDFDQDWQIAVAGR